MTRKKILVVDDEWPILELLKFKLNRLGFEALTAKNEKEFWQKAFEEKPDLIILDIWLRDKLGTDIYESLLNFGFDPRVPVIFITALVENQPAAGQKINSKYALYSKPFDFDRLAGDIHRLLSDSDGVRSEMEVSRSA